MDPVFTNYSNYADNAGFQSIIFGAGADVMEVEMNELQQIQNKKFRDLIRNTIGEGVMYGSPDPITYSSGALRLQNTYAFVDGYILKITSLALTLATGSVRLAVWEEDVQGRNDASPSTLKVEGNEQETSTVVNEITDSRLTEDFTTRRKVLKYNLILSTETVEGASYLDLATVTAGVITASCSRIRSNAVVTALAVAALPSGTNGFGGYAQNIATGVDLNGYKQSGFFSVASGAVNLPSGWTGGMLCVIGVSTTVAAQLISSLDGTKFMHRVCAAGSWSAWRSVWTSGFQGTGSGLGADTIDTFHAQQARQAAAYVPVTSAAGVLDLVGMTVAGQNVWHAGNLVVSLTQPATPIEGMIWLQPQV